MGQLTEEELEQYREGYYTPAPNLKKLPDYDTFRKTMGGSGYGFDRKAEGVVRDNPEDI